MTHKYIGSYKVNIELKNTKFIKLAISGKKSEMRGNRSLDCIDFTICRSIK